MLTRPESLTFGNISEGRPNLPEAHSFIITIARNVGVICMPHRGQLTWPPPKSRAEGQMTSREIVTMW
jgi:hypothetical protein